MNAGCLEGMFGPVQLLDEPLANPHDMTVAVTWAATYMRPMAEYMQLGDWIEISRQKIIHIQLKLVQLRS